MFGRLLILARFPLSGRVFSTANLRSMASFSSHDAEQERLMAEECILLDTNDRCLGSVSKRASHKVENIKKGMLHRAFSVFLFNSEGKLLLQQRSDKKITFPLRWTNTCCSHPLYREGEREEKQQLGVKRAAVRKLDHELGIAEDTFTLDELHFLTRIHYQALSDGEWGEHEIDYILLAQKDVKLEPNPNEIQEVRYVNPKQLHELFEEAKTGKVLISPWFRLICDSFLFKWWDKLESVMQGKVLADNEIHRL